jgi:ribosomal protein S18 acetylase RimI-like enzyme
MPIQIRRATATDREFVRTLSEQVFVVYGHQYPTVLADERFDAQNHSYLIAEDETECLGFALLESAEGRKEAELHAIAVTPDSQQAGVGRMLLEATEQASKVQGATHLALVVAEVNASGRALFEQAGFENLGYCGMFGGGQRALRMRKRIALEA